MDVQRPGSPDVPATCLQMKVVYGLTLQESEGFVESLFDLMRLGELPVPDYSTLSKRQGDLDVQIQAPEGAEINAEEINAEEDGEMH